MPAGLIPKPPHVELFKHPLLIYYNYMQSMLESELLFQKLRHERVDSEDFKFYESLFDPNLRISILGFSLGGLRALASFAQEPTKYHTCNVFNSGVELSLLNTEFLNISKGEWKGFLDKLYKEVRSKTTELSLEVYWEFFSGVFLGVRTPWLKEGLKNNSQKLLFILSGGDQIVPSDKSDLEVAGHGLTVFKIAGVGHIPTMDPQWSPWLNRIAEVISNFVSQTGRGIWSHHDIVSEFSKVLEGTPYFDTLRRSDDEFGTPQLRGLLKYMNPEQQANTLKLYYASMAYYPHFRELLNAVVKWKKRERKKASNTKPNDA